MALEVRRHGGIRRPRLKALEDENRKLKKLLAESMLDVATLREAAGKKLLTPSSRRMAVTWAIEEKGYSQRRACRLVGLQPKTYRYASREADERRPRSGCASWRRQRRRFGYRRLHILLRREGILLNHKKLYRLYREERLTVRSRGGRKRALGTRAPMALPQGRTSAGASTSSPTCWSTAAASGCWPSSTTSPASAWRWSSTPRCPAAGWRANSTRIVAAAQEPLMIVSDNGTELTSHAILRWQQDAALPGTTSRQASRSRMPSSKASTAGCATNASTSTCSAVSPRHAGSSKRGGSTTIPHHNTHLSMSLK